LWSPPPPPLTPILPNPLHPLLHHQLTSLDSLLVQYGPTIAYFSTPDKPSGSGDTSVMNDAKKVEAILERRGERERQRKQENLLLVTTFTAVSSSPPPPPTK